MTTDAYTGPLPVPTPESRPFWHAAREHRLSIPYCDRCARWFFYPRPLCPFCLGDSVTWRDASGRGVLVTFVINPRGPRNFPIAGPYVVGVVELAEGPRMMSRIVDVEPVPERLACDMPLEVGFEDLTPTISLPVFRPVDRT